MPRRNGNGNKFESGAIECNTYEINYRTGRRDDLGESECVIKAESIIECLDAGVNLKMQVARPSISSRCSRNEFWPRATANQNCEEFDAYLFGDGLMSEPAYLGVIYYAFDF